VLLSILDEGRRMSVHLSNDRVTPFYGQLRWQLASLDGKVVSGDEETVLASPLKDTQLAVMDFSHMINEDNCRELVFTVDLLFGEKILASCLATFAPNKHFALKDPHLRLRVRELGGEVQIKVKSKSLARFVELSAEGIDVLFSDNYFDVPVGRTVTITSKLPDGWDLGRFRKALKVQSLFDSFA
jgi:beta-mannosidase